MTEEDEIELKRFQLIYDLISDEYNAQRARKVKIDERASQVIVFVGILTGILSSFGTMLVRDISKKSFYYDSYMFLFILSLIFLSISIIGAFYAYKIQKWKNVPVSSKVMEYAVTKKPSLNILQIVSDGRCQAINNNRAKIERNAKIISFCYLFFLLGLILLILFLIVLFTTNPIFNSTISH